MTSESLEALEDLFDLLCEREHTNSDHNFYLKLYNTIKKDLEANQTTIDTDKKICVGEKIAVVSYDEYMEVVRENEELKETIVKLVKKLNECGFFG